MSALRQKDALKTLFIEKLLMQLSSDVIMRTAASEIAIWVTRDQSSTKNHTHWVSFRIALADQPKGVSYKWGK